MVSPISGSGPSYAPQYQSLTQKQKDELQSLINKISEEQSLIGTKKFSFDRYNQLCQELQEMVATFMRGLDPETIAFLQQV